MARNFTAQVDAIVAKHNLALKVLAQESIQEVIEIVQTPVAKGGRMRVDVGFLWGSGQGSLNGMPTGPSRPPKDALPGSIEWDGTATILALSQIQFGQTFYFGWTAYYAKYREVYDGFLEGGIQQWSRIVAAKTEEIKKRIAQ